MFHYYLKLWECLSLCFTCSPFTVFLPQTILYVCISGIIYAEIHLAISSPFHSLSFCIVIVNLKTIYLRSIFSILYPFCWELNGLVPIDTVSLSSSIHALRFYIIIHICRPHRSVCPFKHYIYIFFIYSCSTYFEIVSMIWNSVS